MACLRIPSGLFILLIILVSLSRAASADARGNPPGVPVEFPSLAGPMSRGETQLSGDLFRPEGNGPFPAVVLLHDCRGINAERDLDWTRRLVGWGYVVLRVDSFGPRHAQSACTNLDVPSPEMRGHDAYGAARYLHTLPFVDAQRIAAMGWGQGAWTLVFALQPLYADKEYLGWSRYRFQAGVWFYTRTCRFAPVRLYAPLLMLVGGKGERNWGRVERCRIMVENGREQGSQMELIVYPEAYQAFDWRGKDEHFEGHETPYRLLYNAEAEADAIARVKGFLSQHLQP